MGLQNVHGIRKDVNHGNDRNGDVVLGGVYDETHSDTGEARERVK